MASRSERVDDEVRATACETCPGRTLLMEEDNRDGWIATDLVVDLEDHR